MSADNIIYDTMMKLYGEDFKRQADNFDARKFVEKITSNIKSNQKFGLQIIKPKEEEVEVKKQEKNISLTVNKMIQFDQFILKEENKNLSLGELNKIFLEEQKRLYMEKMYKHGYGISYKNKSIIDSTKI